MPESVLQRCEALALKPRRWGVDFSSSIDIGHGTWQFIRQGQASLEIPLTAIAPHNIALACEAAADMVNLTLDLIARCSTLYMPGRMDIRRAKDRIWILDVCHNPDGVRFFLNELASRKLRPAYFICSMLAGKDHRGFYQSVTDSVGYDVPWLFVDSHGDRQMTAHALVETLREEKETAENTQEALTMAHERTNAGEVIVIFGSLALLSNALGWHDRTMNEVTRYRLIGTVFLLSLAAIFLPMIFDAPAPSLQNFSSTSDRNNTEKFENVDPRGEVEAMIAQMERDQKAMDQAFSYSKLQEKVDGIREMVDADGYWVENGTRFGEPILLPLR